MAHDEFDLADLPSEDSPDYFEKLLDNCINAFRISYSDTVALDANGVIGKQRVLVMDNPRYQRETKQLKAKKTLADMRVIQDLSKEIEEAGDEEEEEPEEIVPDELPDPYIEETEEKDFTDFDVRNPEKFTKKQEAERKKREKEIAAKKKEQEKAAAAAAKKGPGRPAKKKGWDKGSIELRLKLFQQQRAMLAEEKGEEEREGDALNIFFIPVTAEEMASLTNVEISVGTSDSKDGFKEDEEKAVKEKLNDSVKKADDLSGGTAFHYEEENGVRFLVEDR